MGFEPSANEQASDPPPPERITIALLMLWTTLSAVLLAIDRATGDYWNGRLGLFSQIVALFYVPLIGAGATAVALMLWRFANDGPSFPSQPGHWLLVIYGITSSGVVFLRTFILSNLNMLGLGSWPYVGLAVGTLLVAAGLNYLAMRKFTGRWRVSFAVGSTGAAIMVLSYLPVIADFRWSLWAYRLEFCIGWLVALTVVAAVLGDWRAGTKRDGLHAVGVFVKITGLLLSTAIPHVLYWLQQRNWLY